MKQRDLNKREPLLGALYLPGRIAANIAQLPKLLRA